MRRRLAVSHLGAVCALSVVATGLAVVTPAVAEGRAAPALHAVAPSQRTARLAAIDPAGAALTGALTAPTAAVAKAATLSAVSTGTLRTAALTPAVPVPSGISVVGATWPEGAMPAAARLLVRTSTRGQWSAWQALDGDDGHDPDPGTAEAAHQRGGTQPYVVTDASAVQVRLDTATGAVPSGASVDVVDPGTSSADSSVGTATPGAAGAAATQPTIYSRAQWGADESLRHGAVLYGSIEAAFVHHTVSQNNYTAAEVPAIIRGIYAFHVNGRGWNDIGYNFLVDRFGRIWEGRYGGIALPVVGAHTQNYNSHSFAMSAIGNFDIAHVPSAIVAAYERLFAWKLTLHGIPAIGTVVLNGTRINRISGHRDVGSTACPGRYLYALLPAIRSGTASLMGTLPRPPLTRSIDGDPTPDLLVHDANGANPGFLTDTVSPVGAGTTAGTGWSGLDALSLSPDLTGDGRPDLVARERATGRLRIEPGNGHGGFTTVAGRGSGWGGMVRLVTPGDINGDGKADIVAVDPTGRLWLYPGDGAGWVTSKLLIGSGGWTSMSSLSGVGDFDGDGHRDLLAVSSKTAQLLLYPGTATGLLQTPVVLGTGFSIFDAVMGAGDLDGDGSPDLLARVRGTGQMRTYYGSAGRFGSPLTWGRSYQNLTALTAGQDVTGDGRPDLLAVHGDQLLLYPASGAREYSRFSAGAVDFSGTDHQIVVGDVNRDGQADIIARNLTTTALELWLDPGGSGAGKPPIVMGTGWGGMDLIEPAGDMTMDGVPDILARIGATGELRLYPLTADGHTRPGIVLAQGMGGMTDIIGVGPNDAGAAPDVIARDGATGSISLYGGNGPGQLLGPLVLFSSTPDLHLVASGDVDGDGRTDVVAQLADGSLALLGGTSAASGGLSTLRPLVTSTRAVGHELG